MTSPFIADHPFLWDAAWQTTLLLLLGVAGSLLWARRPARAHRFLALAMAAALLAPLLSHGARSLGWGLFAGPSPAAADEPVAFVEREVTPPVMGRTLLTVDPVSVSELTLPAVVEVRTEAVSWVPDPVPEPEEAAPPSALSAGAVLTVAWGLLTGLFLLHLLASLVRGWRFLARATPLADPVLESALQTALSRLRLGRAPALYTSEGVVSPLIWCWSRRPVLLLPASAARPDSGVDWVGILCHELAHWKRRDHLVSLLGELAVALLPLQPLAWWGRRRLNHLCEQACDDWVLASGQSPVHYAESLLGMLPQHRPALALTAVRCRRALARRIERILSACGRTPAPGRAWTLLAAATTAAAALLLALAQQRPATAEEPKPVPPAGAKPAAAARGDAAPAPGKDLEAVTVTGRVLGPDDKPLAEAQVLLFSALQVTGEARSDREGRFQLEGKYAPKEPTVVFATGPGFGLGWQAFPADPKKQEVVIRLAAEQTIRGRLIDLQGQPAAGVKLQVVRLGNRAAASEKMYLNELLLDLDAAVESLDELYNLNTTYTYQALLGLKAAEVKTGMLLYDNSESVANEADKKKEPAEPPAVSFREPPDKLAPWPRTVTTDAEGRFTLKGIGRKQGVGLLVRDERFALQVLTIPPQEKDKPDELALVLAPPRVIEGTVTEAESGRPIPNARVRALVNSGRRSGRAVIFLEDGNGLGADWKGRHSGSYARFVKVRLARAYLGELVGGDPLSDIEVKADEKGRFRINLHEAGSYTLVAAGPDGEPYLATTKSMEWPKAAVRRQLDFVLPRGVWVGGKVTESPGDKPLAGARVDFWAKGLKLPEGARHPRTAHTGADGTFKALLPAGSWHLLVNGPTQDYLYQKIAVEKLAEKPEANRAGEGRGWLYPDGWTALEVKLGAEPKEAAVSLRRAAIKGQLVGPDGKPIASARMLLRRELTPDPPVSEKPVVNPRLEFSLNAEGHVVQWVRDTHVNEPVDLPDGKFEFPVHDPDSTYRVLFLDANNQLGAVLDFKGKQFEGEPVTVRLAPCGSAKARFVDENGKPLADYRPLFWAMLDPIHTASLTDLSGLMSDGDARGPVSGMCEVWMGRADPKHYGDGPRTDAEGRVTLPCLVPGANYRISQLNGKARDFKVESGQAVDLVDVPVAKAEQTKKLPVIKSEK